MARIPSSRNTVHRGLRIPDLRAGDDSPLRTSFRHAALAIFHIRQLPTQRLRPCGLNATSRTRSQPCADDCSSRLSGPSRDAHAVPLRSHETRAGKFCDAVRLTISLTQIEANYAPTPPSCSTASSRSETGRGQLEPTPALVKEVPAYL